MFLIIGLVCALLAACLYGVNHIWSWGLLWQLPLVFIGVFLATICLVALITVLWSLFFSRKKTYEEVPVPIRFWFYHIVELLIHAAWVRLEFEGLERLPDTPCLLVQNHRSCYDAIITIWLLRKREVIYVSKPENINLPFFGRFMHRMRYLAIDRTDPRNAMKTLMNAADMIKTKGRDVCIWPEGTRNKQLDKRRLRETGLLPFHNGVFKIAQLANAPIAVMTIAGTENITKNCLRRVTRVTVSVDAVIPAQEAAKQKTAQIGARAAQIMLARMEELEEKRANCG